MNIVTSAGNTSCSYIQKNLNPSDKIFSTILNMEHQKWICWPQKMHLMQHFSSPLLSSRPAGSTV